MEEGFILGEYDEFDLFNLAFKITAMIHVSASVDGGDSLARGYDVPIYGNISSLSLLDGSGQIAAPNNGSQQQEAQPKPKAYGLSCGGSLAVLGVGVLTTGAAGAGLIYAPELEPEIYEGLEGALTIQHLGLPAVAPLSILVIGAEASWQNCHR